MNREFYNLLSFNLISLISRPFPILVSFPDSFCSISACDDLGVDLRQKMYYGDHPSRMCLLSIFPASPARSSRYFLNNTFDNENIHWTNFIIYRQVPLYRTIRNRRKDTGDYVWYPTSRFAIYAWVTFLELQSCWARLNRIVNYDTANLLSHHLLRVNCTIYL